MRKRLGAAVLVVGVGVAGWLTLPSLTARMRGADAFVRAEIAQDHWKAHGFVELVPAVRLPTTHRDDGDIHVWVKLPDGAVIRSADTPSGPTLDFPAGTAADRVEHFGDHVTDVRGTVLTKDGEQFHVFVPRTPEAHSKLVGWSWRRGDDDSQANVTHELVTFLKNAPLPSTGRAAQGESLMDVRLDRYAFNNQCARCHVHEKPESANATDLVRRRTDRDGFFVPLSVLSDEGPLERHRERDLNLRDPFITLVCTSGKATIVEELGRRHARCPDGDTVRARLDVRAALAANDAHAHAVCNARRYLHAHMDEASRARFAAAFSVCGIP